MWRSPTAHYPRVTPSLASGAQRHPSAVVCAEHAPSPRCPFANASSFLQEALQEAPSEASSLSPGPLRTPVGAEGGAERVRAHAWLMHNCPGQPVPGRLVAGLRKLPADEFMIEQAGHMMRELELKRRCEKLQWEGLSTTSCPCGDTFSADTVPASPAGLVHCMMHLDWED